MRTLIAPVVALSLAGACRGHPDALLDVPVAAATLQDVSLTTGALLGGFTTGSGTLVITEPDGDVRLFPVELRGGTLGVAVEVDVDGPGKANRAELVLPRDGMVGNDLLGRYRGTSGGISAGVGFDVTHLTNREGVELGKSWFSVGAGVHLGFEWLRVDVSGAELTGPDAPPVRTGCGCAPPPPHIVDTDPIDSARPTDTGDTGPADTGAEPTDTGPPSPVDPDPGGGPAGGDTGAAGLSEADGCDGCAAAPALTPWWGLLIVGAWARRRRG